MFYDDLLTAFFLLAECAGGQNLHLFTQIPPNSPLRAIANILGAIAIYQALFNAAYVDYFILPFQKPFKIGIIFLITIYRNKN